MPDPVSGWLARVSRRAMIVGGAAVAGSAFGQSTAPGLTRTAGQIDAAARQAIADGACPGVQIAAFRNGVLLYAAGIGLANLETMSAVTPKTIFRIGSLTKQFAAAAIIKLASQGKLRVADAAADYLPGLKRLPAMTLLELMNHTAGLHDDAQEGSASPGTAAPPSQVELAERIAGQHKPLDFGSGTAWLYSNSNYIVLGAVIEKVTERTLSDALDALIFRPVGLRDTAIDHGGDVVRYRASGYTALEGKARAFANADYIQISEAGGAGAMRSNANDLVKWHHALLSGELFEARWLDLMMIPGRLRDGRLSGANRFSPSDANYGEVQYACGLLVQSGGAHGRVISHNGFINGFAATLESYPDKGATFAVLCNGDVGPALPFRAIRRAVVGIL